MGLGLNWGNIGIMEKKLEATIQGLGSSWKTRAKVNQTEALQQDYPQTASRCNVDQEAPWHASRLRLISSSHLSQPCGGFLRGTYGHEASRQFRRGSPPRSCRKGGSPGKHIRRSHLKVKKLISMLRTKIKGSSAADTPQPRTPDRTTMDFWRNFLQKVERSGFCHECSSARIGVEDEKRGKPLTSQAALLAVLQNTVCGRIEPVDFPTCRC